MTDTFDLSPLLPLQKALDEEIAREHGVTYESTSSRRILALLVELGEFANETRSFKYWSFKGPSPKEVVLDEYADGLHFLLSLGIPLGAKELILSPKEYDIPLYDAILDVYGEVVGLSKSYDLSHYKAAFSAYLGLLPLMGYGEEDAKEAYLKKLKVNHQRQEGHY